MKIINNYQCTQQIYKISKFFKQSNYFKYFLYFSLILILCSWSVIVFGQTAPSDSYALAGFKPATDDDALTMLGKIAGDVGAMGFYPSATDSTAVKMFKIFNTAVVALGAVMFMWNILSATVNGAHDGEFLGKRYNSYWLPTRTMIGVVLIMPLMNGWSPAQALMGWAAWSGTGIASHIAKNEDIKINQSIAKSVAGVTVPMPPDADILIGNIFSGFNCVVGKSVQQATNQQIDGNNASQNQRWGFKLEKSDKEIAIKFGDENSNMSSCSQSVYKFNDVSANASQSVKDYNQTFKNTITNAIEKVINSAKSSADSIFANTDFSDPEARQKAANEWYKAEEEIKNQFYKDYQNGIKSAIKTAYQNSISEITNELDTGSWIRTGLAGISALTKNFQSASANSGSLESTPANEAPPIIIPEATNKQEVKNEINQKNSSSNNGNSSDEDNWLLSKVNAVSDTIDEVKEGLSSLKEMLSNAAEGVTEIWGKLTDVVSKGKEILTFPFSLPEKLGGLLKISVQMGQDSPLGALQSFGFNILTLIMDFYTLVFWVLMIIVSITVATTAFSVTPLGAGIPTTLMSITFSIMSMVFTISMILIPLIFFGLKLVAVLPFAPILMWIGALTGYFVIFIESLFGAPLWALTHLDTDGEGLGPKTGHGYLFLLNLIFRPSIMIIAFFLATNLLVIIGGFANGIILGVVDNFISSSANYLLKCIMILGAVFVWVSLMENLVHTCFSLVNTVPQQVFNWIGGQFGSNIGSGISEQVTQGAGGKTASVGGEVKHSGHAIQHGAMHNARSLNNWVDGKQKQKKSEAANNFKNDQALDKHNELLIAQGAAPSKSKYSDGSTWEQRQQRRGE